MLVCDEAQLSLTSVKYNFVGTYTGDLGIEVDPKPLGQLVFVFLIEGDLAKRPPMVTFDVMLPGEAPKQMTVPLALPPGTPPEGRDRVRLQVPFPILAPVLRAGRIEGRVTYGDEVVAVRGPWITVTGPATVKAPS